MNADGREFERKTPRIRENRGFDKEGFPTVRQSEPELVNSEDILDRVEKETRNTLVTLSRSRSAGPEPCRPHSFEYQHVTLQTGFKKLSFADTCLWLNIANGSDGLSYPCQSVKSAVSLLLSLTSISYEYS